MHEGKHVPEQRESLWMLTVSPGLWVLHLLASYITAAIWCAKHAGPDMSLGFVRGAVGGYTVVALLGIAVTGWVGFRRQKGDDPTPHDGDTPRDRHQFLGFAVLLLSGLSFFATVYVALVIIFFDTCH